MPESESMQNFSENLVRELRLQRDAIGVDEVIRTPSGEEPPEYSAIGPELHKDLFQAILDLRSEDIQPRRRALIRSFFACVEGTVFIIKQLALETEKRGWYTAAELAILREESYALNSRGDACVQSKFLRTDENVIFALHMLNRTAPVKVAALDTNNDGWHAFKRSLQVRHRVTHPKRLQEFRISDEELQQLGRAILWFQKAITSTLVENIRLTWQENDRLKQKVKDLRPQTGG